MKSKWCDARLLSFVVLVTLAACSRYAATADEQMSSKPMWTSPVVREELRIGLESGQREYLFGAVGEIAVGRSGAILVADVQERIIRRFGKDGTFLNEIGGRGDGPGEYREIFGMKVLPSGEIAVWDGINRRLTLFTEDGAVIAEHLVPKGTGRGSKSLFFDQVGGILVRGGFGRGYGRSVPLPGGAPFLLRVSLDGAVGEEIEVPDESLRVAGGGGFALERPQGILRPFTVHDCWSWSPLGYLVYGRNDRYEVALAKRDGELTIRRSVEPVFLLPEEKAEWSAYARSVRQGGRSARVFAIPDSKPAYRDIFVGENGRVWIQRYVVAQEREPLPAKRAPGQPALSWYEPPTFDVFESNGSFLGTVVLPHDAGGFTFKDDHVWGRYLDEQGTTYVVQWRVVESAGK